MRGFFPSPPASCRRTDRSSFSASPSPGRSRCCWPLRNPAGLKGVILCASFVKKPFRILPAWIGLLCVGPVFRLWPAALRLRSLPIRGELRGLLPLALAAIRSVRPEVVAARVRALMNVDTRAQLQAMAFPLLYLQALRDPLIRKHNAEEIRRIRPDARLAQIDTRHFLLQLEPKRAAAEIVSFLEDVARMTAGGRSAPRSSLLPRWLLLGWAYWKFAIPTHRVEVRSELVMFGDLDGDHRWVSGDLMLLDSFLAQPFRASDSIAWRLDLNRNGLLDEEDLQLSPGTRRSVRRSVHSRESGTRQHALFPGRANCIDTSPTAEYRPRPLWRCITRLRAIRCSTGSQDFVPHANTARTPRARCRDLRRGGPVR